ncbi:hypothetical protein Tco_0484184 [Tanacetum coccineum]
METQAIDDQDHLVNYDNDNENDDLGYRSEEYFDEGDEEDENNHSNGNVVKRGITRLYKFRREYGKPDGIKLSVTFDALNRISGKHRALFSSFLGDMVREHIGLKILSWKKVDSEARDKLWDEITRYFDVDLTVRKLVRKRGGYARGWEWSYIQDWFFDLLENVKQGMVTKLKNQLAAQGGQFQSMSTRLTPLNVSPVDINPINSSADEEGGTTVVGLDASCIPDVGNNGFKRVKDAVGGFFTWPKDQVVFDLKATPPSTIQMNVENKAPKIQTKRKNVYVSSDAMQRQAKKKSLQKSLNY